MKFSAVVLALAAGASAFQNVTYTTEVVTAITTFCPQPTEVEYGGHTYTVTEATTLTITNCDGGCTIKRPITTISSVVCSNDNCNPPAYHNSTATSVPANPTKPPVGTITNPAPTRSPLPTAGAGRTAALSGGALAGVLGLAAFVL
ncbi:Clock-controlled protein 6 [Madurella fahalii]|uniref:Clock-controlled protein 6 n=1 Tax=Madurella fahalii TaxID=1157608 RepID=A0ABQ0G819_9PEZI